MNKIRIAAILAAAAVALSGCSTGSRNSAVITVGDQKVSGGSLDFYVSELMNQGDNFDDYKEKAAEDIENMLLISEVSKEWGFDLSEEEEESVTSSLIRIRQQMGGLKEFGEKLKKYGTSEEFVKELIRSSTYETKYQAAIDEKEITDEEMRAYFSEHYLRAKHVLIMTKDMTTGEEIDAEQAKTTADEVLAKAQAGEDFDALIDTYGEDPGMSTNPDGYIFTDGEMVQEFEDEVKALAPGEIGMCETDYGYHIILRLALDETPELFEQFYSDNSSSVRNAIEEVNYNNSVAEKAEEYGIKYEINEDALAKLTTIYTGEDD